MGSEGVEDTLHIWLMKLHDPSRAQYFQAQYGGRDFLPLLNFAKSQGAVADNFDDLGIAQITIIERTGGKPWIRGLPRSASEYVLLNMTSEDLKEFSHYCVADSDDVKKPSDYQDDFLEFKFLNSLQS